MTNSNYASPSFYKKPKNIIDKKYFKINNESF